MRAAVVVPALLLALGACRFNPSLPADAVVTCTRNEECPRGQTCEASAEGGKRCCRRPGCVTDPARPGGDGAAGSGGTGREAGMSADAPATDGMSRPSLQTANAGPVSVGGAARRPGLNVSNDTFERAERTCLGSICVTGGITP